MKQLAQWQTKSYKIGTIFSNTIVNCQQMKFQFRIGKQWKTPIDCSEGDRKVNNNSPTDRSEVDRKLNNN